ncbi:unnamed protein product [Fusarium equiseti]|uniref:Uncharacterized protein n=1 Tax=Fusarium equiseti TaxID=61235 RepID=A0A8J2JBE5_FUSEQ|nr:unnamed protein product [Fusarium equiseti]
MGTTAFANQSLSSAAPAGQSTWGHLILNILKSGLKSVMSFTVVNSLEGGKAKEIRRVNVSVFETAVKLAEASAGLEDVKAQQAIDVELLHAAQAIMNTPAFRSMEQSINDAGREIDRFGRAIDGLLAKRPMGYIGEMCTDERTKLNRQIKVFNKLIAKSKQLQRACNAARLALEQSKARLTPQQEQARLKIAELEGEMKVLPAQLEYNDKKKDYDNIALQVNLLVIKLDNLSDFIKDVRELAKDIVNTMKKGISRVTRIVVMASAKALVENGLRTKTCQISTLKRLGMSAVTFMDKLYFFHHGLSWEGDIEAPLPEFK